MCANTISDGPGGGAVPFTCAWRHEALAAASVQVSGELDIATAPRLDRTLREALEHAQLVVLNTRDLSFMDGSGLHTVLNASNHARQAGKRLIMVGISPQVAALLEITGTRELVDVLREPPAVESDPQEPARLPRDPAMNRSADDVDHVERWIRPLDNHVNARVLTARVMAIPGQRLWFQDFDSVLRQAWAPAVGFPLPAGTPIEVYLDGHGEVNGWREPNSNLAINQRRADPASPQTPVSLAACQGQCGLAWQVPAASQLTEHDERCLTCAGPLVHR